MLKDILAISGQPGLYKIISKSPKNVIVESLDTGRRFPAHSANKIISLEDIAIFTETGEKPLKEVFAIIFEKEDNKAAMDPKKASANELKNYFSEIIPDYDKDRVYVSDMKKVLNWYNILHAANLLNFEEEEKIEDEDKKKEDK